MCVHSYSTQEGALAQKVPKMDKYPAILYETITSIENILPYYVIKKVFVVYKQIIIIDYFLAVYLIYMAIKS